MLRIAVGCFVLAAVAGLSGCANRAYNDLYIENMAAEIRNLEDQLYEYDHEYSLVEQELTTVLRENAQLRAELGTDPRMPSQPSSQDSSPRRRPIEPDPAIPPIIDLNGGDARTKEPQSILETNELPSPPDATPASNASPFPGDRPPKTNDIPGADEFDADSLVPPTIVPGEVLPPQPSLPEPNKSAKATRDDSSQLAVSADLELSESRIEVPARLASNRNAIENQLGGTTLTPAAEQVTDQRVVELAFHPSLSRAANFDDEPDDDGLYLLLQPLNENGQMVSVAAELSIVVLDPASDERIGRWNYSAEEVQAKLQSIGANQGISLTLPWNGPDPTADRVLVFVRYTFPNGRQVVGEREIFVSSDAGFKSVWAPRGQSAATPIAQASGPSLSLPPSSIVTRASHKAAHHAEQSSSKVVRPAAGTSSPQPAPTPSTTNSSPWSSR